MKGVLHAVLGAIVTAGAFVALGPLETEGAAAPCPAPQAVVADAGMIAIGADSAPFAPLPGHRVPEGTFIEVAHQVWFIAPPGFVVARPTKDAMELATPGVSIVVQVTDPARLLALKGPTEAIELWAGRNGYGLVSLREWGQGRQHAVATRTNDDGVHEEVVVLQHMHVPTLSRVTVMVIAKGDRVGDPAVATLIDESFNGRLMLP
jgi:hypothetical protein